MVIFTLQRQTRPARGVIGGVILANERIDHSPHRETTMTNPKPVDPTWKPSPGCWQTSTSA
ncbi:MAG: hypothetical protein ABIO99_09470 [Candidatus Limnocylindria bacterium]